MAAEEAGWIVFGVMGVGAAIPVAVERISNNFYAHTDNVALTLGVSGLLVHAALEGAALVSGGTGFRLALIAHRLLVGLMIWWLLRPRHGPLIASLGILTLVIATAAGYAVGSHMFGHGAGSTFYQAFVAGMLVHVVFCQCRGDHQH